MRYIQERRLSALLYLGLSLGLGLLQGCAQLHSPAKEALGKDVKDAWGKVDLHKPLETARANYEGIHARQLAALDELKAATRERLVQLVSAGYARTVEGEVAVLQSAMGISPATHPCKVDKDLGFCVMDHEGFRLPYRSAQRTVRNARTLWTSLNVSAQRHVGRALPSCTSWQAADGRARQPWLALLSQHEGLRAELGDQASLVTESCAAWLAGQQALTELLKRSAPGQAPASGADKLLAPSNIPSQLQEIARLEAALDAQKLQAAEADAAVAKARKSQEDAGAEASRAPGSASALQALQSSTEAFADAADKVLKASALFPDNPFLKELTITLKSDALTAFFKTVKDAKPGEEPPPASGTAAAAPLLFANYFDATTRRFKAAEAYGLATLALEEQLLALEQQRARRETALLEQRLKLAQEKLRVMQSWLDHTLDADAYLIKFLRVHQAANLHDALLGQPAVKQACPAKAPSSDPCYRRREVLVPVPPDARTDLWLGLGTYLHGGVSFPHQLQQLTADELALARADRLAASELNLQVWEAVLASNVNQLEAWSKFGLSTDEFQQAINNVLTALIAVGVLK